MSTSTKKEIDSHNSYNWNDGLKILLAVMTFGFGWFADNQATVIAFAAMTIVWIVQQAMEKYGYQPKKALLTIVLFVVALVLALLFSPVALPIFPSWNNDIASYTPLLIAYVTAFLSIAGKVVAYATGVYNILLAQVFEKLPDVTVKAYRDSRKAIRRLRANRQR